RPREFRSDSKKAGKCVKESAIHVAQPERAGTAIELLEHVAILTEVRCPGICSCNSLEVRVSPGRIADQDIFDCLCKPTLDVYRYGEPEHAVLRLDLIAIAPITFRELGIVVQNEFIDLLHQIEISLPRDIGRLQDRHALHAGCLPKPIKVRPRLD